MWSNRQKTERELNLPISKCIFSLPKIAVRLIKHTYIYSLLSCSENDQNCIAILVQFFLEIELCTCTLCFPYRCHGGKAVISFSSATPVPARLRVGGIPNQGLCNSQDEPRELSLSCEHSFGKDKILPQCVESERNLDLCRYKK